MANRCFRFKGPGPRRIIRRGPGPLFAVAVAATVMAATPLAQTPAPNDRARTEAASQRAAERIRALQRESDALASQEKTLLVELRKLEIERQLRVEEVARIDRELNDTRQKVQATIARAAALRAAADNERPDVEARLSRLYKMGRAGYWRLLLDVDDLRSMGRAYRMASAMTRLDRERILQHQRTLEALARERQTLEARAKQVTALQQKAVSARIAVERAVAARTALVESIDARRDLNAQLMGELQAAQARLQASLAQIGAGHQATALPLRPFRGALAWPAPGIVTGPFGRQSTGRFGSEVTRNGVEISLAEGQTVRAVHEGTVAFADQFTGYGNLVIIDHGDRAYSLYGHLESLAVARGDRVDAQTPLGASGRNPSGNPSLYFELRIDAKPVDPLQWLKK